MSEIILPDSVKSLAKPLDDKVALEMLKSGDYLPYFMVGDSNAKLVKEDKLAKGMLAVVQNQTPIDLGKETPAIVIAERAKAMRFGEQVLSYFDVLSEEFKKTQADSAIPNSGAMAGLEFLIWLPAVGDTGMFAGFFCGSKTLKREALNIRPYCKDGPKPCLFRAHQIKTPKYIWYGIQTVPYSTPIGVMPDSEELAEVVEKFLNPKSSVVEKVDGAANPGRAR